MSCWVFLLFIRQQKNSLIIIGTSSKQPVGKLPIVSTTSANQSSFAHSPITSSVGLKLAAGSFCTKSAARLLLGLPFNGFITKRFGPMEAYGLDRHCA